jgi:hypothetical protein
MDAGAFEYGVLFFRPKYAGYEKPPIPSTLHVILGFLNQRTKARMETRVLPLLL